MATTRSRFDDLEKHDLSTSDGIRDYTKALRDLFRDLVVELNLSATEIQALLSTVPPPPDSKMGPLASRVRARAVAVCLRHAARAVQYAGGKSVRCWGVFLKLYAPELGKNGKPRPQFTFSSKAS